MSQSYQARDDLLDLVIDQDMVEKWRLRHLILGQRQTLRPTFWAIGGPAFKT
jgi:hypothetical protein